MAVLYGCGGGGGGSDVTINAASPSNPAVPVTLVNPESQACVPCHAAAPAGGTTAQSPAALYALSLHNTENQATCVSCHQTTPGHSAAGADSKTALATTGNLANPDLQTINAAGTTVSGSQCMTCHTKTNLGLPHFNNDVSNNYTQFKGTQSAQFVDLANDKSNVKKCTACHTPHDASKDRMPIFRAYAQSRHGDVNGEAWIHYRWKDTNLPPKASYSSDRSRCQRCHTTIGFVSQITQGATILGGGTTSLGAGKVQFDTSGNATKDNTKQVLRCDACHDIKNNKYNVRDASASLTALYTDASTQVYKDVAGNWGNASKEAQVDASGNVKFPDLSKSNLCINCHAGRFDNGYTIKNSTDTTSFTNTSLANAHYLAAGAVLFRTGGYRYDDTSANLTYDNSFTSTGGFKHKYIGSDTTTNVTGDARNYKALTGDGGPCVSCHMFPVRHTFSPVTKDKTTGKITNVNSGICTACHTSGMSTTTLEEQSDYFKASLDVLKAQLVTKGYYFATSNPYFFTDTRDPTYTETGSCSKNLAVRNWNTGGHFTYAWNGSNCTTAGVADVSGTIGTGKNNMGAAHNYNLLVHEPGAYAHNRYYSKRLIWDSIDWLDNNIIDNSVVAAVNALAAADKITSAQKDSFMTYFTSGGVVKRP